MVQGLVLDELEGKELVFSPIHFSIGSPYSCRIVLLTTKGMMQRHDKAAKGKLKRAQTA